MRHVPDGERRARLAVRHALAMASRLESPEAATRAMTVLHATEPATVYLSCWARVASLEVADVARALYEDRTLVKQLAMRRTLFGRAEANLPSRFLDELPQSGVERERLRPTSWSDYGRPSVQREFKPREDVPELSTGDTVRHASLGTGIVTQIEVGGVVTVRFEDGSERRLMLEYAPLERLG